MLGSIRRSLKRVTAISREEKLALGASIAGIVALPLLAPYAVAVTLAALVGSLLPLTALAYRLQKQERHYIANDHDATRNAIACALAHFTETDRPALVTLENQKQLICYTDGRKIYSSKYMLQTLSPRQVAAVHAHEVEHMPEFFSSLTEPFNSLSAHALLRGGVHVSRIMRGAGLGAAAAMTALGTVVPASVVLATAATPYLLNVATQAYARHKEYAADAGSARMMGSPLPLSQALRHMKKIEQSRKDSTPRQLFSRLIRRGLTKADIKAAVRRAVLYEGPFTHSHPSLRQRRLRLQQAPRDRNQQALITHLLENAASGLKKDGLSWLRRYT